MGLLSKASDVKIKIQSNPGYTKSLKNKSDKKKSSLLSKLISKFTNKPEAKENVDLVTDYASDDKLILLSEETEIIDLDNEYSESNQLDDEIIDIDDVIENKIIEEKENQPSSELENNVLENIDIDLDEETDLDETSATSLDESEVDPLKEWEEDALREAEKDPFLTIEESVFEDITKENLTSPIEITNQEDENNSSDSKLELYVVLLEIVKDLVRSKDLTAFYENLLYSIQGQLGSESIIIFSSKNKDLNNFSIVIHEGIDLEDGFQFNSEDPVIEVVKSFDDIIVSQKLNIDGYNENVVNFFKHPFCEVIAPIKSEENFLGFITLGPNVNGNNYSNNDLEFLKMLCEMTGSILLKLLENNDQNISEADLKNTDLIFQFSEEINKKIDSKSANNYLLDFIDKKYLLPNSFLFLKEKNSNTFKLIYKNIGLIEDNKIPDTFQISDKKSLESQFFQSLASIKSLTNTESILSYEDFIIFPFFHFDDLIGFILILNKNISLEKHKEELKSIFNIYTANISGLLLFEQKTTTIPEPVDIILKAIENEISYSNETKTKFTLVVIKIQNVSRIINILGQDFFNNYYEFIRNVLKNNLRQEDFISRVGQGKIAIVLRENIENYSEKTIGSIKADLGKFSNSPKDFKLSLQIFTLAYPTQSNEFRKFIEIIEES
jgi:GGDEF domain-containing protein